MQKPINSAHQPKSIRPNPARVPVPSSRPRTEPNPPRGDVPRGKATLFPDPGNPHRFLVPPHDHPELDLEMDSGRGVRKDLALQDSKGYQDVADLFPDPIYSGGPVEGADVAASKSAPSPSGTEADPRHLGLRGGASFEYLATPGGEGCGDSLLDQSAALSAPGETATDSFPKGEGPDGAPAPTTGEGEMLDLLTANIAWGVLAQQVLSTFGISAIAAGGFYVGNVLIRLAHAKIGDWLDNRRQK